MTKRTSSNHPDGTPSRFVRPVAPASALFHVYRLESLLYLLHDLWQAKISFRKIDISEFRKAAGNLLEASNPTDFLNPALEQASRIINEATGAFLKTCDEEESAPFRHLVGHLRNLLIGMHDVLEAAVYQTSYPAEYANAQKELCRLADIDDGVRHEDLILICLRHSAGLATKAVACALQGEARHGNR